MPNSGGIEVLQQNGSGVCQWGCSRDQFQVPEHASGWGLASSPLALCRCQVTVAAGARAEVVGRRQNDVNSHLVDGIIRQYGL